MLRAFSPFRGDCMRIFLLIVLSTVFCAAQDSQQQTNQLSTKGTIASSDALLASADVSPSPLLAVSTATPDASVATTNLTAGDPLLIAPVQPVVRIQTSGSHETEIKSPKRAWLALAALQHGSAAFDAWSTRQSILSGHGYERDPLIKPFADSAAIYPALQVLPIGLDYLSNRMMRSSNGMVRRLWWVPQTVSTVGFVWSGARNLHVAGLR